ncbi:hypothetical protein BamMEX5DRAFT_1542 [Burkholderia ambifaria MEX-5]|uniref:Uncharacterized protein n=1 Tax=Burkholderia ambifaria MEX-5 TaxID=396597 RepID=B1T176_9BURK|nr:hypothetical protein BamMEX5DRAFT_1542 [Burkholderia ambifaria MEX-5]
MQIQRRPILRSPIQRKRYGAKASRTAPDNCSGLAGLYRPRHRPTLLLDPSTDTQLRIRKHPAVDRNIDRTETDARHAPRRLRLANLDDLVTCVVACKGLHHVDLLQQLLEIIPRLDHKPAQIGLHRLDLQRRIAITIMQEQPRHAIAKIRAHDPSGVVVIRIFLPFSIRPAAARPPPDDFAERVVALLPRHAARQHRATLRIARTRDPRRLALRGVIADFSFIKLLPPVRIRTQITDQNRIAHRVVTEPRGHAERIRLRRKPPARAIRIGRDLIRVAVLRLLDDLVQAVVFERNTCAHLTIQMIDELRQGLARLSSQSVVREIELAPVRVRLAQQMAFAVVGIPCGRFAHAFGQPAVSVDSRMLNTLPRFAGQSPIGIPRVVRNPVVGARRPVRRERLGQRRIRRDRIGIAQRKTRFRQHPPLGVPLPTNPVAGAIDLEHLAAHSIVETERTVTGRIDLLDQAARAVVAITRDEVAACRDEVLATLRFARRRIEISGRHAKHARLDQPVVLVVAVAGLAHAARVDRNRRLGAVRRRDGIAEHPRRDPVARSVIGPPRQGAGRAYFARLAIRRVVVPGRRIAVRIGLPDQIAARIVCAGFNRLHRARLARRRANGHLVARLANQTAERIVFETRGPLLSQFPRLDRRRAATGGVVQVKVLDRAAVGRDGQRLGYQLAAVVVPIPEDRADLVLIEDTVAEPAVAVNLDSAFRVGRFHEPVELVVFEERHGCRPTILQSRQHRGGIAVRRKRRPVERPALEARDANRLSRRAVFGPDDRAIRIHLRDDTAKAVVKQPGGHAFRHALDRIAESVVGSSIRMAERIRCLDQPAGGIVAITGRVPADQRIALRSRQCDSRQRTILRIHVSERLALCERPVAVGFRELDAARIDASGQITERVVSILDRRRCRRAKCAHFADHPPGRVEACTRRHRSVRAGCIDRLHRAAERVQHVVGRDARRVDHIRYPARSVMAIFGHRRRGDRRFGGQ